MNKDIHLTFLAALWLLLAASIGRGAEAPAQTARAGELKDRLTAALTRHLGMLVSGENAVTPLKGKSADGQEALAFYLTFEKTGDPKWRDAALTLADRLLQQMRAAKFGVLPIKEKTKPDGEAFMGGGPPAFGLDVADLAYILQHAGGRADDLKYLAGVLDRFPWNEDGWWAADIDVKTGVSKVPMSKPSPINKTASVALAAGVMSPWLRELEPELAARLKQKADRCLYAQILPAQEASGFWHYSLSEKDPKNKDILGYFMLTTTVLMELQEFNPEYREPRLTAALQKAQAFAARCIAPMTEPNTGPACAEYTTPATPRHYSLADDLKRAFELGAILLGADHFDEGAKIMEASLAHFPYGNAGEDGVHAATPSALALRWLR